MSSVARRTARPVLAVTLAAATFAAVAILGLSQAAEVSPLTASSDQPPAQHGSAPSGKFVVAYVLGQSGSDTGDVFAPYEVIASSPDFFVYTVAATADPAPVGGGMSIVPAYTFDDVEAGTAPAPDLVVIPAVNNPAASSEEGARDFVAEQHAAGVRVLGICAGSRLLAAAGILDGHRATSHWSRIAALEKSNPKVSWIRGQRYVQDGLITTTGAVTSGIPGALKVIADMAGAAEATRVGEEIRFPGWSLDAPVGVDSPSFGLEDVPVLLNTMFPWGRPSIDVELRDAVGEIDAGAIFEVYSYSQAAVATAHSETGTITTKHGLVIRTLDLDEATGDTLVAGGLGPARPGGWDAAFEQLSRNTSAPVLESVGQMLGYPLDRVTGEPAIGAAATNALPDSGHHAGPWGRIGTWTHPQGTSPETPRGMIDACKARLESEQRSSSAKWDPLSRAVLVSMRKDSSSVLLGRCASSMTTAGNRERSSHELSSSFGG